MEFYPSQIELIKYVNPETRVHEEIRILEDLAPHWETIANFLGIRTARILTIRNAGTGKTLRSCLMEVFEEWRVNGSWLTNYSRNWRGLYNLLRDSGRGRLADKLAVALNAEISTIHSTYKGMVSLRC